MPQDDAEIGHADLGHQLSERRYSSQPDAWQSAAVPPPGLTAADIRNVHFADAAFGERGYSYDEVDAFLDHVAGAFQGQTAPTLTSAWIRSVAFTLQPVRKRGYAVAEVDAFLDRLETDVGRRAGQQVAAPERSQPYAATPAVSQSSHSADPGPENQTQSRRRRSGEGGFLLGVVNFLWAFSPSNYDDHPNWMFPAMGAICLALGVVTHRTTGIWIGCAILAVTAIYLVLKLVHRFLWKPSPRDDQSPQGRHSR